MIFRAVPRAGGYCCGSGGRTSDRRLVVGFTAKLQHVAASSCATASPPQRMLFVVGTYLPVVPTRGKGRTWLSWGLFPATLGTKRRAKNDFLGGRSFVGHSSCRAAPGRC